MAKPKLVPPPLPDEEEDDHECPKCPPVGAPAWMATFADMATLLMAFFVLILSFAEFNQPRFKMVAGSLKEAFGVQRLVQVTEQPKGMTVVDMAFSPSPEPSVTKETTQDTTKREQKNLNTAEPRDETDKKPDPEAQKLVSDLQQALQNTDLSVSVEGDTVTVNFPDDTQNRPTAEVAQMMQQVADAMNDANAKGEDVQIAGLSPALGALAEQVGGTADGQNAGDSDVARRADLAEARMQVALREQIDRGLVTVERDENRVFVTVGAGGAFASGSADLTAQAKDIMARLALSASGGNSEITVTGHTDNVPLSGGEFRDNWGLAAGRASAVVRALGATGNIAPDRMSAVSKGESVPVASNDTPEGREKNRRIEIEINFDE